MPSSAIHSYLTKSALSLCQLPCSENDCQALINDYCNLPDQYFSQPDELEKYMYFTDGIQFHYLPDTPYNELYRYWSVGPANALYRTKPFRNDNFEHAEAGFSHYLTRITAHLREQETAEAQKFLGCLLHVLQDATFGAHALEGPGGVDLYAINRLLESERLPLDILVDVTCLGLTPAPYQPRSLGNSVGEAVLRLYREYSRRADDSRKCAVKLVLNTISGEVAANSSLVQRMFDNAVQLCADVVYTAIQLGRGAKADGLSDRLTDLEPYVFPCGGAKGYRFRTFSRDAACDALGQPQPLLIGGQTFDYGIAFGAHYAGQLLYRLPPGLFSEFNCIFGFYGTPAPNASLEFDFINEGESAVAGIINAATSSCDIHIKAPRGDFGIRFRSTPASGVVILATPRFTRSSGQ